ncbi:hypothetical protein FD51_GL002704 [Lacticaseibacillus zeae DSM 20178 = KCTC 3804]|uniref:Uncharacterized protein n=1 Tax=Lacticaseibacillus zeae DSM 20178 = KCTC 3804 TaxID=1423816 RepID=A0A0R1EU86_LACZE|nr:hypothetical protein FD51_GL002704 [Lacticaseibacillus zeae DSM 20178 = KCTC 3804]
MIQGVTNSRLDAHGRKQAFALGLGLKASGLKFDRVVSSDLIRAQETAQQILLGMDEKQPIETNSGLREEMTVFLKVVNSKTFHRRSLASRITINS